MFKYLKEQAGQVAEKAAIQAAAVREKVNELDLDSKTGQATGWLKENVSKASNFIEESLAVDPEVCYVTDRLIAMGMPGPPPLASPKHYARILAERHPMRYMIWNFSEVSYDYTVFDDQVSAPGAPGAPENGLC
jgi:hypothetical protein